MIHLKRFKPFALLVLLLSIGFLYLLILYYITYESEVSINLFRPVNSTRNDVDFSGGINKHLSLLRQDFKKKLDKYEALRMTLGKRFTEAAQNASQGHSLDEFGKKSRQQIVCNDELFLLIQIHSRPEEFMNRQAIRLSWGSMEYFIGNQQEKEAKLRSYRTVFLIGQSSNPKLNQLVAEEASIYKDIVVGPFEDTFRNLYMKMLFSISWPLTLKCHATYILKTDDDCFVNVGNLLDWLNHYNETNGTRPLYAGRFQKVMLVVRDNTSRYYVSKKDHPAPLFQPYISGGGYVFSGNLLPSLAKVSKRSPLFANEDALLGSLMHRLRVQPTDNIKFLPSIYCSFNWGKSNWYKEMQKRFREANMCGLSRQIVLHWFSGKQQLEMHFNSILLNYFSSFCSQQKSYENMRNRCY